MPVVGGDDGLHIRYNGKWKMENGEWKMENGKWRMENGKWKMNNKTNQNGLEDLAGKSGISTG
jgi:hypothetical protein